MRQKIAIMNSRKRADQHVLRIAGDRRHASDVRCCRHRQQIRKGLHPHLARDAQYEGHHDQAHDIVDEEGRQKSAGEHHRGQQVMRPQSPQHRLHVPFEESDQMEVPHDQHHREQKHDGLEVDVAQGIRRTNDPEGDHGYRPDNGRTGAINLQARKLSQREYHIAGQEDGVCGGDANVRQRGGRQGGHWVRSG